MRTMIVAVLFILVPIQAQASARRVLATHLPVWCMVKGVAGEGWDVGILIRPGADVHSFSLMPGDIKSIRAAEVVFKNGAGLEAHLEKGLRTARRVVDASAGIELIRSGEGDSNPHTWLDPLLASSMVDKIAEHFPDDPGYHQRAESFKAALMNLHKEAQRMLGPLEGNVLVTYHESFAYLARRYGLRYYSLTGFHSETPLPARMRGLYDMAREGEIKAVFVEAGYPQKALRNLARDLGLRVCTLDNLTIGEMDKGYYMKGMKKNMDTIARCLGAGDE